MARIKIDLPIHFYFACVIPIRITDVNYGGHVGNDTVLSIIHEARMQYFKHLGYTEMNFGGTGMLMADVTIEFKKELFYGDAVIVNVTAGEITNSGFNLFYKLEVSREIVDRRKRLIVAAAKTGMVCYDYINKKIVAIPEEAKQKLAK